MSTAGRSRESLLDPARGRVDALEEIVEGEAAVQRDDDLAVEDEAIGRAARAGASTTSGK